MKVIVLTKFNDLKENTLRNEGDIFEVEPDRYNEIMAYRADLIQVYEPDDAGDDPKDEDTGKGAGDDPKDETEKPAPKRGGKTKAKTAK